MAAYVRPNGRGLESMLSLSCWERFTSPPSGRYATVKLSAGRAPNVSDSHADSMTLCDLEDTLRQLTLLRALMLYYICYSFSVAKHMCPCRAWLN